MASPAQGICQSADPTRYPECPWCWAQQGLLGPLSLRVRTGHRLRHCLATAVPSHSHREEAMAQRDLWERRVAWVSQVSCRAMCRQKREVRAHDALQVRTRAAGAFQIKRLGETRDIAPSVTLEAHLTGTVTAKPSMNTPGPGSRHERAPSGDFRQAATTIGWTGQQECKVCDTAIGDFGTTMSAKCIAKAQVSVSRVSCDGQEPRWRSTKSGGGPGSVGATKWHSEPIPPQTNARSQRVNGSVRERVQLSSRSRCTGEMAVQAGVERGAAQRQSGVCSSAAAARRRASRRGKRRVSISARRRHFGQSERRVNEDRGGEASCNSAICLEAPL